MNHTLKNSKMSAYLRIAIQILSFLLIPGLFSASFLALRDVVQALISGNAQLSSLRYSVITLLATVPAAAISGRWFCGWLCSFGAMQDLLWFVSGKAKLHRRVPQKMDAVLRWGKYIILGLIAVFLWTGIVTPDESGPWAVFGQYTAIGTWPGLAPLLSVSGGILILSMILSLFVERAFCRYFCPMGAVYAVLARLQRFPVQKERTACGSCRACTHQCSMGLELDGVDAVTSGECIQCGRCVEACPRGNARHRYGYLGLVLTLLTVAGCTAYLELAPADGGALAGPAAVQEERGPYPDGVFTGEGRGYRGTTTVTVTVENGNITEIEVTSSGDDRSYLNRVVPVLIPEIISAQNTDVDAVTGATKSSDGILAAVSSALGSAGVSDYADAVVEQLEQEAERALRIEAGRLHDLSDGQYSGRAEAFRGEVEVLVTVESGRVTDISIVSYYDHEPYFFQAAPFVIDGILSEQSLNVDVYTGATYSSNGIIKAVADALDIDETGYSLAPEKPRAHKEQKEGHVAQKFIESPEQYESKVEKYKNRELKP